MKYNLILFILLIITVSQVFASEKIHEIVSSNEYFYGEAVSDNEKEASDKALDQLTKNIFVIVKSSFTDRVTETNGNVDENAEKIIKTYSTVALKNVNTIKYPTDDGIKVFHYIKKSNVSKIFDERKKLISDLYKNALKFENQGNIGYALKNYYFSCLLMNSIPDEQVILDNINFTIEIPKRINNIIINTSFQLTDDKKRHDKERQLTFSMQTFEKPSNFLEFTFWDGNQQVHVQGQDGIICLKLLGSNINIDELKIKIKYKYYESKNEIKAVAELWDLVNHPSFKSIKIIPLKITSRKKPVETKQITSVFNITSVAPEGCKIVKKIQTEASNLLNFLQTEKIEDVKKYYKNDEFIVNKIKNFIEFNHCTITDYQIEGKINKTYDGWEFRKIRVNNYYPTIKKQTTEYIVLDFSETGELTNINFAIMDQLYSHFVEQGKYGNDWGNRQTIIKFIEKYRTAFLNRNLKMIDSIFADEAVIIVGRVLQKTGKNGSYNYEKLNNIQPDIEYLKYTKDEYLNRQAKLFNAKKDIWLGYSSFNITKTNKQQGVYGVSLRQNYYSDNYSDEGHLFLLIDFNEKLPKIYVRSWQPQEWDSQKLVQLSNFKINK